MIRISQKLVVRKFVDASAKRSMSTKLSEGINLISEHAVAIIAVVGLAGTAYGVITSIVSKDLKHIGENIQAAQNQHEKDLTHIGEKIQAAQNQHEKDLTHIGEKIDKDFEIARNQNRSDFKVARDQLNTDSSGIRDQTAKKFRDARDQTAKDFRDARDQHEEDLKHVSEKIQAAQDQNKRDFDENLKKFDTIEQSLVAIVNKLDQK
jgi:hypothetical protein